jgi:uncharacterized protein YdhG (YjbR/CyaY superfamily)
MDDAMTSPGTIDDYIARFPKDVQTILSRVRNTIRDAAPGAEEAIKYQIPTFVLHGNLVHFAAFAKHVGFYPTPSGIEEFKEELSGYVSAKGSVQFPLNKPIPYQLIRKIVLFRVKENCTNSEAKSDGGNRLATKQAARAGKGRGRNSSG